MSAAHYLEPGRMEFDLVVMDEASQVKPEDALGVIARGKQLVVVGDPKQLPPTSFFDRSADGEDDDDAAALSDTDSILDAALPLFPMRRLRWHYRSRHEKLIAYS
ncbi:TPA: AAA family ATPase, partial [Klebsiella pneumoniae]|nr:AAA family ATPase [Klebsiella pneumoniae]